MSVIPKPEPKIENIPPRYAEQLRANRDAAAHVRRLAAQEKGDIMLGLLSVLDKETGRTVLANPRTAEGRARLAENGVNIHTDDPASKWNTVPDFVRSAGCNVRFALADYNVTPRENFFPPSPVDVASANGANTQSLYAALSLAAGFTNFLVHTPPLAGILRGVAPAHDTTWHLRSYYSAVMAVMAGGKDEPTLDDVDLGVQPTTHAFPPESLQAHVDARRIVWSGTMDGARHVKLVTSEELAKLSTHTGAFHLIVSFDDLRGMARAKYLLDCKAKDAPLDETDENSRRIYERNLTRGLVYQFVNHGIPRDHYDEMLEQQNAYDALVREYNVWWERTSVMLPQLPERVRTAIRRRNELMADEKNRTVEEALKPVDADAMDDEKARAPFSFAAIDPGISWVFLPFLSVDDAILEDTMRCYWSVPPGIEYDIMSNEPMPPEISEWTQGISRQLDPAIWTNFAKNFNVYVGELPPAVLMRLFLDRERGLTLPLYLERFMKVLHAERCWDTPMWFLDIWHELYQNFPSKIPGWITEQTLQDMLIFVARLDYKREAAKALRSIGSYSDDLCNGMLVAPPTYLTDDVVAILSQCKKDVDILVAQCTSEMRTSNAGEDGMETALTVEEVERIAEIKKAHEYRVQCIVLDAEKRIAQLSEKHAQCRVKFVEDSPVLHVPRWMLAVASPTDFYVMCEHWLNSSVLVMRHELQLLERAILRMAGSCVPYGLHEKLVASHLILSPCTWQEDPITHYNVFREETNYITWDTYAEFMNTRDAVVSTAAACAPSNATLALFLEGLKTIDPAKTASQYSLWPLVDCGTCMMLCALIDEDAEFHALVLASFKQSVVRGLVSTHNRNLLLTAGEGASQERAARTARGYAMNTENAEGFLATMELMQSLKRQFDEQIAAGEKKSKK